MSSADSNPADSDPVESRPEEEAPPPLSVDQLTHAFAQLMGENPSDSPASSRAAASAADGSVPDQEPVMASDTDEAEDDDNVTPSSILEALLFVGHPQNEPLTSRQMASYLRGVSPQEVDALVEHLNCQYAEQQAPYAIASVGAGYQMTLRDEFLRLRDNFYGRVRQAKLSQVAVDLLAIVAYHQPISGDDIERFRGQPSGSILAQLVRRQLLRVDYSQEKPRRKIYRTTDRFLDLFGLESLEDLPSHEDF